MNSYQLLKVLGLSFFVLGLSACMSGNNKEVQALVETGSGSVEGYIEDGVFAFKGIPYAKAERFMPPQAPEAWEGIKECTRFSRIAMQVNSWSPDSVMNEQELFTVNVWTQGINDGKKRPVMFWLHGGGFSTGASDDPITDGHLLAKNEDVVLVSINHRLNILGFLDLSDFGEKYAHSGNVGMLDVVAGLNWVKENIAAFGGDPDNVTIFGESGGGGKVATLMCMPPAQGLFHKAIIQSGTLLNVNTKDKSTEIGRAVLDVLGLSADQVHLLDTVPYKKLVEIGNEALVNTVGVRTPGSGRMFGFGPVPDGEVLLQQPFTPGFSDISADIPVLIGTTLNELMRTAYGEKDLSLEQARERLQPLYGEDTDTFICLYEEAYPDYTPQDLLSIDRQFRPLTITVADARSEQVEAPVFTYLLTWKSPVDDASRGSFHGVDIPLAFNNIELGKHWTGDGEDAVVLAGKMSASWANFARTGNPNVGGILPEWSVYSRDNGETMIFDSEVKVKQENQKEWLENNFVKTEQHENKEINTNIESIVFENKLIPDEDFQTLIGYVLGEEDNGIQNLCLLDRGTNRSYKNDSFRKKRHKIIENEKNGTFIPVCTRNVFMKYYSEELKDLELWNENDRNQYFIDLVNVVYQSN